MKRSVYFSTGFVLFTALVILWVPWLGETLFYSKGEPREAVVAVSMLNSGNWVLPVSCGTEIPFKPPFLAWLIAIFAVLFNGGVVNEFIARLPSALAAIALVMASYAWVRRIRGERFGLCMALILATSVEFYRAAAACRVDMVLTACIVGAIYLLFEVRQHRGGDNFWRYAVATVLLTCAVLTKGPIGAFLPCLVAGLYMVFRGDPFFPVLGRMAALCLASCVVPAVWYYAAWLQGGDNFLNLVWEENFQRLTGTMSYESHECPFWYNFITIIVGMLPWTLLALMSLSAARRLVQRPFKPAGLLAITAVAAVVIFYCIPSSKRSVYLLPAYPFMAYGVASIAETLAETRVNIAYTRILAFLAILAPFVVLATQFFPVSGYSFTPVGWWAYVLLALPVVVAVGWLMQAHPRGAIGGACLICWAMYTCYGGAVMPAFFNPLSDKPEAGMLDALAADSTTIYIVGSPKNHSVVYALNYYMNDRVRRLPDAAVADTCRQGTVLLFTQPADTTGLPKSFHLSLLKERLSDTRHPAFFAVKKTATVAKSQPEVKEDVVAETMIAAPTATPVAVSEPTVHKVVSVDSMAPSRVHNAPVVQPASRAVASADSVVGSASGSPAPAVESPGQGRP